MTSCEKPRRWDIQETRKLMGDRWRDEQFKLAPMLHGVIARLSHAQYHRKECRRLIAEHIDQRLEQEDHIFMVVFPSTDEEMERQNQFFMESEAHMLACAQAIHATADILAHVAYYVLGLHLGAYAIDEKWVRLDTVISKLESAASEKPDLHEVLRLLTKLRDSQDFKNISDLVNQAKHRGGPRATLAIQPSEDKAYEIRFSSFYRETFRPAIGLDEIVSPAFQVANETVVDVGIALNELLSERSGEKTVV